jgi:predicted nucleic acid-binding protein
MTLYVDTSALLKRYVREPGTDRVNELLSSDPVIAIGRHAVVEVRRNLARLLSGRDQDESRVAFATDLAGFNIVELDEGTCELAATVAEQTLVRTLDALHLGAARRLGAATTLLTFDTRQADAARLLGLAVLTP